MNRCGGLGCAFFVRVGKIGKEDEILIGSDGREMIGIL